MCNLALKGCTVWRLHRVATLTEAHYAYGGPFMVSFC